MILSVLRVVVVGLFVVLASAGAALAAEMPTLIHLQVKDRAEQDRVGRIINLEERTRGFDLYGWATAEDLKELGRQGYSFEVVTEDRDLRALTMCTDPDGPPFEPPATWDCYPTYSQYVDLMNHYATTYPALCSLVDFGGTQDGDHRLLALKISDNVTSEEDEPEFFYTATMHGDETAGYVLTLCLIDDLLSLYATDPEISGFVDNMVIWINPLANPDGTFAGGDSNVSGSQRSLSNGADPNRSFPDPSAGDDPGDGSWYTEVQAMIDLAEAESFVMSANFHGGAEVVNYPWDAWSARHPDDTWYQAVSRVYADAVHAAAPAGYMDGFNNGITNGYDWYQVNGGRQDFMNYYHGCREVTVELSDSKTLDSNQLEAHWGYNRQALLDFMKQARYGIRGLATDATSGDPVAATIKVVGHDSETYKTFAYADPEVGDYQRPIEPGTWDLEFSAWGYVTQTVSNITVAGPGASVLQDVVMVRESGSVAVSGTITDSNSGLPVPGAVVRLTGSPLPATHSDASGNYVFAAVMPGTYDMTVGAWGYLPETVSGLTATAGGGDLDVDIILTPDPAARVVEGTVTDQSTGLPLEGATVVLVSAPTPAQSTNALGEFVFGPVPPGTWVVGCSMTDYHREVDYNVVVGGVPGPVVLDFELRSILYVDVTGTVTNGDTGAAIVGAQVSFFGATPATEITDATGQYGMNDLIDGVYDVEVSAAGFGILQTTVVLDQATEQLDFQLFAIQSAFNEDFESDDGGFAASGSWQWGTDSTAGAASGTKVWGTVIGGDYGIDDADWTLDSPAIELDVDLDSAQLEFAHWYSIETGWDGGHVLVSSDGGASFQLLTPDGGGYPDDDVDGLDGQPGYTGTSSGWETATINLGAYIGQNVVVRWRFGTDGSVNDYRGWYIDDVRVLTTGGTPSDTPFFADGFESGDTTGWHTVVGGS
ncbi:MAG: M14 family zinc carboxypeptidase [Acidobacteriota bacterium]